MSRLSKYCKETSTGIVGASTAVCTAAAVCVEDVGGAREEREEESCVGIAAGIMYIYQTRIRTSTTSESGPRKTGIHTGQPV